MSSNIGVHGNLFGGTMLAWLDEAGAIYSSGLCNSSKLVTRKISEVEFLRPVKSGRLVRIYGECIRLGTTSVTIRLEARRHNPYSGKQKLVCCTEMVFVHIDEEGDPVPLIPKQPLPVKTSSKHLKTLPA